MAVALNVSEYWLMGLDVPMEREDAGAVAEQKQRFEAYAKGLYEMREPEMILKLYGELSEENRAKAKVYIDYYGAVEPPVRCGVSHLSELTEPLLEIAI